MNLLQTQEAIIYRRAEGHTHNGYYEQGPSAPYNIKANIQPISGKELEQLPEGDRNKMNKWVYTDFVIKLNDIMVYNNIKFEIQTIEDWSDFEISYFKARAVKLDDQNEEI